jgi:hypothetical protein
MKKEITDRKGKKILRKKIMKMYGEKSETSEKRKEGKKSE